ncbi:hypothetical protein FRB99_002713, partial [Tulasnella sp. 403]
MRPGDKPPKSGYIIVDPRTTLGERFRSADKPDSLWRVVPYTFLRACIFKSAVLDANDFLKVKPIFEINLTALRMFLDERVVDYMDEPDLTEFKLNIAKYGGNSGTSINKAHVVIVDLSYLGEARRDFQNLPVRVESTQWVYESIINGFYEFTSHSEIRLPDRSTSANPFTLSLIVGINTHRVLSRMEFTETEDRRLVKFLAMYYPIKGDKKRGGIAPYDHIVKHPDEYPWAQNHSASTWQNHYARKHAYFESLIEQYLDAHPKYRITDSDAEERRVSLGLSKRKKAKAQKTPNRKRKRRRASSDGEIFVIDSDEAEGEGEEDVGGSETGNQQQNGHAATEDKEKTPEETPESDDLPELDEILRPSTPEPQKPPSKRARRSASKDVIQSPAAAVRYKPRTAALTARATVGRLYAATTGRPRHVAPRLIRPTRGTATFLRPDSAKGAMAAADEGAEEDKDDDGGAQPQAESNNQSEDDNEAKEDERGSGGDNDQGESQDEVEVDQLAGDRSHSSVEVDVPDSFPQIREALPPTPSKLNGIGDAYTRAVGGIRGRLRSADIAPDPFAEPPAAPTTRSRETQTGRRGRPPGTGGVER